MLCRQLTLVKDGINPTTKKAEHTSMTGKKRFVKLVTVEEAKICMNGPVYSEIKRILD